MRNLISSIKKEMTVARPIGILIIIAISPLFFSSCSGKNEMIRHGNLVYNVKEVFEGDPHALALARAAGRGDVPEIDRLVTAGAKINTVGKYGITPLWWAAWAENYDGFSALLERKADPNLFRAEGLPIMYVVAQFDEVRFLSAALKHGGKPDTLDNVSGDTLLFRTVLFDRKEHTALLLKAGANVNAQQTISGWTLPMMAIGSNANYKLVYELLQMGADHTLETSNGNTLADIIDLRAINPNDEQYIWREKVTKYLRSKGVDVERPAHESPRSK